MQPRPARIAVLSLCTVNPLPKKCTVTISSSQVTLNKLVIKHVACVEASHVGLIKACLYMIFGGTVGFI